uniref:Uncharacterized protein n=1 Tax=Candidatus Methanophaga sp. ANME-1 ERB7 TaxID=2759913 RepID=A0A7G9Z9G2_9EURY|nr:hypothetical protein KGHFPOIM_00038 [Methanosarcinales archaeon ANME-1 ERB7]
MISIRKITPSEFYSCLSTKKNITYLSTLKLNFITGKLGGSRKAWMKDLLKNLLKK